MGSNVVKSVPMHPDKRSIPGKGTVPSAGSVPSGPGGGDNLKKG